MEVLKENTECSSNNLSAHHRYHHSNRLQEPADPLDSLVTRTLEISLLSPSSPQQPPQEHQEHEHTTALFAQKLQMKLKSHLETSASSDSSTSSEEFYSNSSATEDTTSSNSEIFYDFDDVVYDEELTSDYGTGGSNTTVVASRSSSGSSSTSGSSIVVQKDEEEEGNRVRYQRSSSLKSGKTPPGTPMKKIVRFADAMGLDLIDIKVFLDEIPKVPKEAYRDLHIPDYTGPITSTTSSSDNSSLYNFCCAPSSSSNLNFVPLFHQPVTMPDFFDKIRDKKVLLENAYLTQETITQEKTSQCKQVIKGTVRVMNLDFHKSVYVRYTYNDWKEFVDFQATYMPESCDGFSDRFEFRIEIDETKLPPPYVKAHDDAKIGFACRFHCQGNQFWDNNQSRNYVFQNVPSTRAATSSFYDDYEYENTAETYKPTPDTPISTPTTTTTTPVSYTGGGGGSHLSSSLYSPSTTYMSFYDHAYGSYQFGSACFY